MDSAHRELIDVLRQRNLATLFQALVNPYSGSASSFAAYSGETADLLSSATLSFQSVSFRRDVPRFLEADFLPSSAMIGIE